MGLVSGVEDEYVVIIAYLSAGMARVDLSISTRLQVEMTASLVCWRSETCEYTCVRECNN